MTDIAGLLKSEITRLAKKALKQGVTPLQKASTAQRRELSALKKQVVALERELAKLRRGVAAAKPVEADDESSGRKVRFVAKGMKPLRTRLGLSAREFGLLVGVSEQTVYNWESRTATPRAAALASIAELRGIGKKEARARLEQLAAS